MAASYEVDTDIINARIQDAANVLNEVNNSKNMFDTYATSFQPAFMQNWVNKTYKFSELSSDAQTIAKYLKEYIEWMQTTLQKVIDGDLSRAEQYAGDEDFGDQTGGTGAQGGTGTQGGSGTPGYQQLSSIEPSQLVYGPSPITTSGSGTGIGYIKPIQAVYGPSPYTTTDLPSLYDTTTGERIKGSQTVYGVDPYSTLYNIDSPGGTSKLGTQSVYDPSKYTSSNTSGGLGGLGGYSSLGDYTGSGGYGGSGSSGPYGAYDPNNLYDPNNPNSPYYKGNSTNGADGTSGDSKNSGLASAIGKGLSGISTTRDALSRSNQKLAGNLTPNSSGLGIGGLSPISMAGLGLAAGGAIAGAGLLFGKNRNYEFTPEDWESLEPEIQNSVLAAMQAVGFEQEDVDAFTVATFSVPKSVIDPHLDNVKDVMEVDTSLDQELFDMYGFTCINEEGQVDLYLLFLMLSLDGVKFDDNYNLYNILNEHLDDAKIDFTYSGINMFEYVKDEDEIEEETDEAIDYESMNLEETEA